MSKVYQLTDYDENRSSFSSYSIGLYEDDDWSASLRNLQNKALQKAVHSLSLKERTVLLLHDREGWSQKDIAKLLSVNKSTVSRNLKRARNKVGNTLSLLF